MKKISIDIPHFYCLEYKEDEKRLIVEIDFREPEIWISKSLIQRWEPPFQSVLITEPVSYTHLTLPTTERV